MTSSDRLTPAASHGRIRSPVPAVAASLFFVLSFAPAHESFAATRSVNTKIIVPKVIDVPLGQKAEISVRVASSSGEVPRGKVLLWNRDIPDSVTFNSHTVTLDAHGRGAFMLSQTPPWVPFAVDNASVSYMPAHDSNFNSSRSGRFSIRMHRWQTTLALSLGGQTSRGTTVSIDLAMTGVRGITPSGDVRVADTVDGLTCSSTLGAALPFRGSGRARLALDLPKGRNALHVDYLGDAFFDPRSSATLTVPIKTGRQTKRCAAGWAHLAQPAWAPPLSAADIPLYKYGFPRNYGDFRRKALENRDAGTLVVQLDWEDVEPQKGRFHFGKADTELRYAIRHGRSVALLLRFQAGSTIAGSTSNCRWSFGGDARINHNQFLPLWAAKELGSGNSFCSKRTSLVMPNYWSHTFLRLWLGYVDTVAAHYVRYRDRIVYVRGAVGIGDEGRYATGPNFHPSQYDVRRYKHWGYTPQRWEAWQEDMLSYYARAFSYVPTSRILYTINHQDRNQCSGRVREPIPPFKPLTIPCTGRGVELDVAKWAVDHGYGLAQNELDPYWVWSNPDHDNPRAGDLNRVFAYAMSHKQKPFIELQTFEAQSYSCNFAVPSGLPPCWNNGRALPAMESDIAYARRHGVSTLEWYEQDLINPKLQPALDLWTQLERTPGHDPIPTLTTVQPDGARALRGHELEVTISVSAPGISGFSPGGTVILSDEATGRHLRVIGGPARCGVCIQIPPNTGSVNARVVLPETSQEHINISGWYLDKLEFRNGATGGTGLWRQSRSANMLLQFRGA